MSINIKRLQKTIFSERIIPLSILIPMGLIILILVSLYLGYASKLDQTFLKSLYSGSSTKITHDGSRTGERVGYQSYCEPEKGFVIYENEKKPFTEDDGKKVLWTQGDIDCYKNNTQLSLKTMQTLSPTPTITPLKKSKSVIANSDSIIDCGPGVNSKQYVKDKSSECKNYIDCGLYDSTNKVIWTLMLKSECDKKQSEAKNKINSNPTNIYSPTIYPPCVVYYPVLGYSSTYYTSPETCKAWQDAAKLGNATPTQSPLTEEQAKAIIDEHNRQVGLCRKAAIDTYGDARQIQSNCNSLYGDSSATEACINIKVKSLLNAQASCGDIISY